MGSPFIILSELVSKNVQNNIGLRFIAYLVVMRRFGELTVDAVFVIFLPENAVSVFKNIYNQTNLVLDNIIFLYIFAKSILSSFFLFSFGLKANRSHH